MKLIFLSNYYNHHQSPSCELWHELTDANFCFVSTESMSEDRKQLGWEISDGVSFVKHWEENTCSHIIKQVNCADIVLLGSAPFSMVTSRLRSQKLVFKYSERIFKQGYNYWKWIPRLFKFWWLYGRHRSLYLLSASAYTTADYAMHGTFRKKSYKWGYFPQVLHYNIETLMASKKRNKILWCGRFLDWKHPDDALKVACILRADGYDFEMDFIGTGEMEDIFRAQIEVYGLTEQVHLLGSMKFEEVRAHMETAGIYLFTSDFGEGWGAVLNESMNSGCAVVACHAIGSVPFLLKHGENGLIYENGRIDGLYRKVKYLLDHPEEQKRMGENAYHTIVDVWNAQVATERFMKMAEEIRDHGFCDLYEDGPCSKAPIIKNHWFKEDAHGISDIKN